MEEKGYSVLNLFNELPSAQARKTQGNNRSPPMMTKANCIILGKLYMITFLWVAIPSFAPSGVILQGKLMIFLSSMKDAINGASGYTPWIGCNKDESGNGQLYQVYSCVDSSASGFIECPISPHGICGSSIEFHSL
ncbi:wounding-induced ribonuclease [Artemisia annua]|uniref:Wounding-induced ribonuclease n=1 Tax=Artemisia annua TaxID=35608 RepID=A0A2U1P271_ARTAN|nr:wounding-induced ribonuclease [Artemisia annua]